MKGKRKMALASAMISALMVGCGSQQAAPLETKGLPQMPPASSTIGNLAQQQAKKGLGAQSVITTAFCDDFNTFDTARWNTYSTPGAWSFYNTAGSYEAANTSVQNGYLVLKTQYESGDVTSTTALRYTAGAVVQSIDKMGYGTYDIWVRLNNTSSDPAVNGSTANGTFADINNYTELDYTDANTSPDTLIESKYGYGTPNDQIYSIYKTNQPASSTPVSTAQNLSQGFHHHKWEWTPNSLKFYVDDVLVHSVTDPNLIPSEAAQMFFNAWPVNKPDWNMLGSAQTRYTMVDKFCYTPPVADPVLPPFPAANTNPIYVPLPVATIGGGTSFDLSDIEADSYQWTFSDGTTASGPYVEHTFATPGTYTATATLSRTTGETATYTTKVAVLPEIQNVAKRRDNGDTMTVDFDLGEVIPGLEYSVDLGDGSPVETRSQFSHTYSEIGTFDYTVTIKDNRAALAGQSLSGGLKAQETTTPPILIKQTSFETIWRNAPEAKMSFTTSAGTDIPIAVITRPPGSVTVNFNAGASQDHNTDYSALTYEWDFGNGQTATGVTASATFNEQKPYVVTLKVANKWGLTSKTRQIIFVRDQSLNWTLHAKYPTITAASLGAKSIEDMIAESGPNASEALSAQTLRAQASFNIENTFPYVMGPTQALQGVHRPTGDDGSTRKSICSSYKLYVNGIEKAALLQGDADMFLCDYMVIQPGSVSNLPAQQYNNLLVSTSGGLYTTNFNVLQTVSVPKVTVSVVPNDFVDGKIASPLIKQSYLTDPTTGAKTNVLNVVFRQKDLKAGMLEFKVPVLAVNNQGLFLDKLTGLFNARFTDSAITSSVVDNVMVNGRAEIKVKISAINFAFGAREINLGEVQLYGDSSTCGNDTSPLATASRNALLGCLNVITTTNFPSSNAPLDIPPFPKELQKSYTLMGHTFYGEQADAAKGLSLYAQTGHILAQGYVEYAAPYLLIPEKREELQKLTEELVADGKIDPADVGKITLMNVGMWASAIPQVPLKPPSYTAIASASRNGLGTTADALESIAKDVPAGLKTSEVSALLTTKFDKLARDLEKCADICISKIDAAYQDVEAVYTKSNYLEKINNTYKQDKWPNITDEDKVSLATQAAVCLPEGLTGQRLTAQASTPMTDPYICQKGVVYFIGGYKNQSSFSTAYGTTSAVDAKWRGQLQAHHTLQDEWAKNNLSAYGYNSKEAPTIMLETNSKAGYAGSANGVISEPRLPHTLITSLQNSPVRKSTLGTKDLQSALEDSANDLLFGLAGKDKTGAQIHAGQFDNIVKCTMIQIYDYLDQLSASSPNLPNLAYNIVSVAGDMGYRNANFTKNICDPLFSIRP